MEFTRESEFTQRFRETFKAGNFVTTSFSNVPASKIEKEDPKDNSKSPAPAQPAQSEKIPDTIEINVVSNDPPLKKSTGLRDYCRFDFVIKVLLFITIILLIFGIVRYLYFPQGSFKSFEKVHGEFNLTASDQGNVTHSTPPPRFAPPNFKSVVIKGLSDFQKVTNRTEDVTILASFNNTETSFWSWYSPPILNANITLLIESSPDISSALMHILLWLKSSISVMVIDASFANDCENGGKQKSKYAPSSFIRLERLTKLVLRSINHCFYQTWIEFLPMPAIKNIEVCHSGIDSMKHTRFCAALKNRFGESVRITNSCM